MTQNNLKIAVTGGIGSGKSTVCGILRELGYPVVSADAVYAQILTEPKLQRQLQKAFGNVMSDGILDRRKLSQIVFSDKKQLERLNAITHPCVMRALLTKMTAPVAFAEVPLLFEGNYQNLFDRVWVVMRDREARIAAVQARSNLAREEVEDRIQNQFDYEKIDRKAHTLIWNDGDLLSLREGVVCALKGLV